MEATIIAAIRGNRANRAGSFRGQMWARSGCEIPVGDHPKDTRGYGCQEADQHLESAKRNKHGNRDNGTKQSAGISANRKRLLPVAWTIWPNSGNMRQSRQRYSILAQKKRRLKTTSLPTTSVSNLHFAGLEKCDSVATQLMARNPGDKSSASG
jgi:hypothetical protein